MNKTEKPFIVRLRKIENFLDFPQSPSLQLTQVGDESDAKNLKIPYFNMRKKNLFVCDFQWKNDLGKFRLWKVCFS